MTVLETCIILVAVVLVVVLVHVHVIVVVVITSVVVVTEFPGVHIIWVEGRFFKVDVIEILSVL